MVGHMASTQKRFFFCWGGGGGGGVADHIGGPWIGGAVMCRGVEGSQQTQYQAATLQEAHSDWTQVACKGKPKLQQS